MQAKTLRDLSELANISIRETGVKSGFNSEIAMVPGSAIAGAGASPGAEAG